MIDPDPAYIRNHGRAQRESVLRLPIDLVTFERLRDYASDQGMDIKDVAEHFIHDHLNEEERKAAGNFIPEYE